MIVSAIIAGIANKATSAASGSNYNATAASSSTDPVEQKLARYADATKMDANTENVRLKPALEYEQRLKKGSKSQQQQDKDGGEKHFAALSALRVRCTDITDILELASDHRGKFAEQFFDPKRSIRIATRTFASFPVDMVKAVVYVPCSPSQFLRLLEFDQRAQWDETFKDGTILHQEGNANAAEGSSSSNSGGEFCIKVMRFDAFPGMISPRDFEVGVCTKIDAASGAAYVKAVSTPYEFGMPVHPGGVRGFIPVSGFIARPVPVQKELVQEIQRVGKVRSRLPKSLFQSPSSLFGGGGGSSSSSSPAVAPQQPAASPKKATVSANDVHSEVTYVALVHPRGRIPVFLLNLIIGKQTSGLRNLQVAALGQQGMVRVSNL